MTSGAVTWIDAEHGPRDVAARIEGDRVLVDPDALEAATGWTLKPEGLCREAVCVPVHDRDALVVGGLIDVGGFAAALQRPIVIDAAEAVVSIGDRVQERIAAMESLEAPDFELPDVEGETFRYSSLGKRKKLVVTWASWCGCRYDLAAWQELAQELAPEGLDVVSVAMDDSAEIAKEWVDHADPRPTFPVLYDREHLLSELYGITNVPSVVWIDEDDHIVRAPVIAPGDDQWKDFTHIDSSVHHDQLRTWVREGVVPEDDEAVRSHQQAPTEEAQQARLERRLGAFLARDGRVPAAQRHFATAYELAPMDFTIRRGTLPLRGGDPFGQEFFDFYQEWEAAGRPGTDSADTAWTGSP